jgi:hypothetical protein
MLLREPFILRLAKHNTIVGAAFGARYWARDRADIKDSNHQLQICSSRPVLTYRRLPVLLQLLSSLLPLSIFTVLPVTFEEKW